MVNILWLKYICFIGIYLTLNISGEIPDNEYEQVIADRYLFSPYSNESNTWPVLENVRSVWQVASLPEYHLQSSEGVWLLLEKQTNFQMCYMSLTSNGTLISLSNIDVTSNGSYLVSSHNKNRIDDYSAALISPNDIKLILCNQSDATSCIIKRTIPFPSSVAERTKKISSGLFISDLKSTGYLYIASDSGLHGLNLQTFEISPYINQLNIPVSSLAWSEKHKTIFIGTAIKLWIEMYINETDNWRFEHVTGLIDAPISSLVYDNAGDKLWIGQDTGITLLSPVIMRTGRTHWYFQRLGGHISNPGSDIGHLPYANITSLSVTISNPSDGCVWLGSIYGLIRFDGRSDENNAWRVFNSARFLPNRLGQVDISSVATLNRIKNAPTGLGSTAVAITNRGLSVIRFEMWTLAKKADYYQKVFIDETNRHIRYGFVADCAMSIPGDVRTCIKGPNDNDGLWTSMYLSSQIFRYAVTNDSHVKQTAWEHFQALYFLNQITGISGYPARSLAKKSEFPPSEDWHPSPINSTLQFKGDTSSDEIVGHEYVYPLVHDLLCENDAERSQAYSLLINITTHILTHNWYLIGESHNHTTWGIWNPNEINNNSFYQESRGLNSLQVLAFLFQTYGYTGDEQFLNGAKLLMDVYGYDINLINQKMIAICDGDFSDDELAYLSYFNLVYAFNTIHTSKKLSPKQKQDAEIIIQNLEEYLLFGLDLSHKYKQMEKSPFYNFIYCFIINQTNIQSSLFDCNMLSKDSVWYLQRFPLELINWQQFNGNRLDIELNPLAFCSRDGIGTLRVLPPDERSVHKWNSGVFDLDNGDPVYEEDPTVFLIGYWGMRYLHLLGA